MSDNCQEPTDQSIPTTKSKEDSTTLDVEVTLPKRKFSHFSNLDEYDPAAIAGSKHRMHSLSESKFSEEVRRLFPIKPRGNEAFSLMGENDSKDEETQMTVR
jgi:hypothetical protein